MNFNDLSIEQKEYVKNIYSRFDDNRTEAQRILADYFDVTTRTIRNWANYMGLLEQGGNEVSKVLIYDLETSRILVDTWWTFKQFVRPDQLMEEPRIITISWKWLDGDDVLADAWDSSVKAENIAGYDVSGWGCDRELVKRFAKIYNSADMVIGVNNDNFDNRMLAQRCLVHKQPFNRFVKSLDVQKAHKKAFRTPSYSMKYQAKRMGISEKLGHDGLSMWRDAQYHKDPKVRKDAVERMITYNVGDIVTTEEMYLDSIPFIDHKFHFGTFNGNPKWSCPNCGSLDTVELHSKTVTAAGTLQYIMRCTEDGQMFKVSASTYADFISYRATNNFGL
jgi:hypothetical protein